MTKLIQGKALYALHRDSRKVQCFIQREAQDLTILSLNRRPVKFSKDFESEHESSENPLIDELCVSSAIFAWFK